MSIDGYGFYNSNRLQLQKPSTAGTLIADEIMFNDDCQTYRIGSFRTDRRTNTYLSTMPFNEERTLKERMNIMY